MRETEYFTSQGIKKKRRKTDLPRIIASGPAERTWLLYKLAGARGQSVLPSEQGSAVCSPRARHPPFPPHIGREHGDSEPHKQMRQFAANRGSAASDRISPACRIGPETVPRRKRGNEYLMETGAARSPSRLKINTASTQIEPLKKGATRRLGMG